MKNLFTLLFCTAALLSAAGCSDSDENAANIDTNIDAKKLIGAWELVSGNYGGEKEDYKEGERDIWTFKDDGTMTILHDGKFTPYQYTYSLKGNRLNYTEVKYDESYKATVRKLTETELVLNAYDTDTEYFSKIE